MGNVDIYLMYYLDVGDVGNYVYYAALDPRMTMMTENRLPPAGTTLTMTRRSAELRSAIWYPALCPCVLPALR